MNEPNKPSSIYDNAIFVRQKKDVPQQDHWAILKFKRISTPGYDKGDPPDQVTVVEWDAYLEEKDLLAAVQKLETEKFSVTEYVVVYVSKPKTIKTRIELA